MTEPVNVNGDFSSFTYQPLLQGIVDLVCIYHAVRLSGATTEALEAA